MGLFWLDVELLVFKNDFSRRVSSFIKECFPVILMPDELLTILLQY